MTILKSSLLQNAVDSPLHSHHMEIVNYNTNRIEERVVAINNLERGVREVGELFGDMALLVHNQGVNIDNIETNIQTTHVNIDRSRDQLIKASQYQTKRRKCYIKCICFTIGILTILIIILIVIPKN
jgi:syntaxin 7